MLVEEAVNLAVDVGSGCAITPVTVVVVVEVVGVELVARAGVVGCAGEGLFNAGSSLEFELPSFFLSFLVNLSQTPGAIYTR